MIGQLDGKLPMLESYDLEEDPLEWDNLAGLQEYSGVAADLKARLFDWMVETKDSLLGGVTVSPTFQPALEFLES